MQASPLCSLSNYWHFKIERITFTYSPYCRARFHLRFKQAQPKMCHSPKAEVGVEIYFCPFRDPCFGFFCWKTLNCHLSKTVRAFDLIPTLRARPEYQLSADIHSPKSWTKYANKLLLYLIKPLLVMRSHGEPKSTTVKVVTTLML